MSTASISHTSTYKSYVRSRLLLGGNIVRLSALFSAASILNTYFTYDTVRKGLGHRSMLSVGVVDFVLTVRKI